MESMEAMILKLSPVVVDIWRLSIWLAILAAIFMPLERLFAVHPKQLWRKGIERDLFYYFLNNLLPAALLSLPIAALAWLAHHIIPASWPQTLAALPLWAQVGAGLVASEFGYYWGHRWCHEVPLLWRFHALHHGAREMDFLVHTHAHPLDMVFGRLCGLVPLYLLGLGNPVNLEGSLVPVYVAVFGTVWGFYIHANIRWRWGPLEQLIATPAFHHWHHTLSGPINRNYSSTFPWLDRAFGTLYLPKQWPADYGIAQPLPETLAAQLTDPLLPAAYPGAEVKAP